jgi:hypothetical protein
MHADIWTHRIDILGANSLPQDAWGPLLNDLKEQSRLRDNKANSPARVRSDSITSMALGARVEIERQALPTHATPMLPAVLSRSIN